MTSKTSFIQYTHCDVCRIHHNVGKKHIYAKHHQNNLKTILKKSHSKVIESKNSMKNIEVHDSEWEKDRNFWCYFCSSEYPKHLPSNGLNIQCLGMIHHLADHSHYENVKKFLKINRSTSDVNKYIISKSEFLSFMEKLPAAESKYLMEMDELHSVHVQKIKRAEKRSMEVILQAVAETAAVETNQPGDIAGTSYQSLLPRHIVMEDRVPRTFDREANVPSWSSPMNINTVFFAPIPTPIIDKVSPVVGPTMEDVSNHVKKQENVDGFSKNSSAASSQLSSYCGVLKKKRRK